MTFSTMGPFFLQQSLNLEQFPLSSVEKGMRDVVRGVEYFHSEVMLPVSLALCCASLTVWPPFYPLISFPLPTLDVVLFEAGCLGPIKALTELQTYAGP